MLVLNTVFVSQFVLFKVLKASNSNIAPAWDFELLSYLVTVSICRPISFRFLLCIHLSSFSCLDLAASCSILHLSSLSKHETMKPQGFSAVNCANIVFNNTHIIIIELYNFSQIHHLYIFICALGPRTHADHIGSSTCIRSTSGWGMCYVHPVGYITIYTTCTCMPYKQCAYMACHQHSQCVQDANKRSNHTSTT